LEYSIIIDDWEYYENIKKGCYKWKKDAFKSFTIEQKIKYIIRYIIEKLYGGGTFGINTIIDHAFTTSLHALTCVLIYALFKGQVGFWTAMLYAINPINNQTSIWLNGRRYQIVIILCLLALLFKPFGIVLYLITPLFQVTGLFLPILFVDISWLFLLIPPSIIAIKYKSFKNHYEEIIRKLHNKDQKELRPKRLKIVIKSYGFYIFNMIFPRISMFNYPNMIKWGVTLEGNKDAYAYNWEFYKGILSLVLTGILFLVPELRLYAVFIFIGTLQWSGILIFHQQLADRYVSLVNIFMMFCLVLLFHTTPYGAWMCLCLFTYYATQLNITMKMYRTIEEFFEYQMFWHPELTRNNIIFANTYLKVKDVTKAWGIVERGLRHDPDDFELLFKAARCACSVGLIDKCDEFIDRARKNFYIGQEILQTKKLNNLIKMRNDIVNRMNKENQPESRQVRRQQERDEKKNNDRKTI
jgi:hypothetical protein